jgi:hypothetical protein
MAPTGFGTVNYSPDITVPVNVPEPGMLSLLVLGLAGVGLIRLHCWRA